jgi:hypothetical protein
MQAGVHPEIPAHAVTRDQFERLWAHSVSLLQRGFASGSILTVDPEEAKVGLWVGRADMHAQTCLAPPYALPVAHEADCSITMPELYNVQILGKPWTRRYIYNQRQVRRQPDIS